MSKYLAYLSKPSTITLLLLIFSVVSMVIVTLFSKNDNSQFFTIMGDLIKVVAGSWAGAMFGEKYIKKGR